MGEGVLDIARAGGPMFLHQAAGEEIVLGKTVTPLVPVDQVNDQHRAFFGDRAKQLHVRLVCQCRWQPFDQRA